ncbi:hypothetical protein P186_2890 [Pyrobaculum ferrireducens]|uniref:Uncharacterized protein n=1 Tax=Pyrobaculum ferrireducens TaxID=1104324 RepID=G7VFR0_9CREN|nr:hypothetical protein P186_2890 [Pyrobaculum ferrireducens]
MEEVINTTRQVVSLVVAIIILMIIYNVSINIFDTLKNTLHPYVDDMIQYSKNLLTLVTFTLIVVLPILSYYQSRLTAD